MHLSKEEVAVHAGQKVLMDIDDSISLIVSDPNRILDWQLRPRQIKLLNISVVLIDCVKLFY
jgi:hypothetical protein